MSGLLDHLCAHVGDHREDGHPVEDLLPGADVACLGRHGPSELSGELPGVHSDLDDVVDEGQQRRQREGGHEQRDEAKLDHCETEGPFNQTHTFTAIQYECSVAKHSFDWSVLIQVLTHFQVLLEEAQLPKALQVVVLLPAAVQALWVAPSLPAAPPVHQPPVRPQGGNRDATQFGLLRITIHSALIVYIPFKNLV